MAASFASSLLKQQQLRAASAVAKGGDEKGGDASANASANASVNASAGATSSGDSTAAPSLVTAATPSAGPPRTRGAAIAEKKRSMLAPTDDEMERLVRHLDTHLLEGHGEWVWRDELTEGVALNSAEFDTWLQVVKRAADRVDAEATLIYRKEGGVPTAGDSSDTLPTTMTASSAAESATLSSTSTTASAASSTTGALLLRRRTQKTEDVLEVRIACVGNVDAGKSTLLGVLTSADLDDGRGHARTSLFKHKHEADSGRTSSVGLEIMGFDVFGAQVVKNDHGRKMRWEEISERSAKLLTFLDLAGHEKYLKTTVFGMTGGAPDYVMLIIGSNAGIVGMTKEHLGLALALNVPVLIAVTKVDMCPPNVLEATIKQIVKILKSQGCRKIPMFVGDMETVVLSAQNFASERICPIFRISNVTGTGLDLLRQFLNLVPLYKKYDLNAPPDYQITETFSVPGVGTVVSGTLLDGIVRAGDSLLLGPDPFGHFLPCVVKSIQRKRMNTPAAYAGQSATFALKKVRRSTLRKGMVMVGKQIVPQAIWEFEAEVLVLFHKSTICEKYQAMVHCGNVRQTASIMSIKDASGAETGGDGDARSKAPPLAASTADNVPEASAREGAIREGARSAASNAGSVSTIASTEQNIQSTSSDPKKAIRTGDRAYVRFRFLQYPEYIKPGARILFREGRTKGVGKVTRVFAPGHEHDG